MSAQREYDVLVYGASSFVGQILCRYLHSLTLDVPLRWAIAGRSMDKLQALQTALQAPALDCHIADADDAAALSALCARSKVIITTVGPYAFYGETLLRCCAESGTDYCDLSGEVQWLKAMLDRYETTAKASGARIVSCCGFDSIPSDLGVFFTQQHSLHRLGQHCEQISMRVHSAKGGFSGGTIASLLNVIREASANPALRKDLANPYLLCESQTAVRQIQHNGPAYDSRAGAWLAPFVMASINTRVVQRSNALLKSRYGKGFLYDEAMLTGPGLSGRLRASGLSAGLAALMLGGSNRPGQWLLKRLLPAPGTGPSLEQQKNGFFNLRFYGRTGEGREIECRVSGQGDPGYGATAKMLGQAAICLARDSEIPREGGFWTPASLMGNTLIGRLQQYADMDFSVTSPLGSARS